MALRKIRTEEDEILRKKSKEVEKIDDKISELLNDMLETMREAQGLGLAAPQIGILKRMIVVEVEEQAFKLVNPKILSQSGEILDIEGCLSVPEKFGEVKRPSEVIVQALDERGHIVKIDANGLLARALCHEIDHLDGVIFTDKVVRFIDIEERKKRRKKK